MPLLPAQVRIDPKLNKFVWSGGVKGIPFRARVRLDRKRSDDEEAKVCSYLSFVAVLLVFFCVHSVLSSLNNNPATHKATVVCASCPWQLFGSWFATARRTAVFATLPLRIFASKRCSDVVLCVQPQPRRQGYSVSLLGSC